MTDKPLDPKLWAPRSVSDTMQIYRDWAATYEADVLGSGYVTPIRIASALRTLVKPNQEILDFGCGTGLAGHALCDQGFSTIDGTDITAEMIEIARTKEIYRNLWQSKPNESVPYGQYRVIVAAGVISLGAAAPEMLSTLVRSLDSGGILAFSFNDPTLSDDTYVEALDEVIDSGLAKKVFREHGPHLPDKGMGSDVIILRKS